MKKTISTLLLAVFLIPFIAFAQSVGDASPVDSCLSLQNNMGYRSRDSGTNGEVSDLQDFLNSNGYLSSSPTGFFGLGTVAAVKKFQAANGLSASGYVGTYTRAKIQSLTCGSSTTTTPTNQTTTSPVSTISSTPSITGAQISGNVLTINGLNFDAAQNTVTVTSVFKTDSGVFSSTQNGTIIQTPFSGVPSGTFTITVRTTKGTSNAYSVNYVANTSLPTITVFGNKDPNPTTGAVTIIWNTSGVANVQLDMACSFTSVTFTTDKGNTPSCAKGGVWNWTNQSSGSILITASGNTTSLTIPFTLTVLDSNGTYTNQKQTIQVTFPAAGPTPTPVASISTKDSCTIQAGASTCQVPVWWSTSNASNVLLTESINGAAPMTRSTQSSGTLLADLLLGTHTFAVTSNGTVLNSARVTATCATGLLWNGSTCAATPTSTASPTGTISTNQTACAIQSGASTCPVTVSWSSSNATNIVVTQSINGAAPLTLSNQTSGTAGSILMIGTNIFSLSSGGTSLGQASVTVTCAAGLTWNGSTCAQVPTTTNSNTTTTTAPATTSTTQNTAPTSLPALTFGSPICIQQPDGTYALGLSWNPVSGATNYPMRLQGPSIATNAVSSGGVSVVGFNNPGFVDNPLPPTGTSYTFLGLTAGTYTYWGHAWSSALGWSPASQGTVTCPNSHARVDTGSVFASAPQSQVLGAHTQCVDLSVNLHRGYEIPAVSSLQSFLSSKGLLSDVSGFYGDKTVAAVKMYQESKGLPQTGMVYGATRAAIVADSCQ